MDRSLNRGCRGLTATFLTGALWCCNALSQPADLQPADVPAAFEQHVAKLRADFALDHPDKPDDIEWVKARIALLAAIDQYGRTILVSPMNATAHAAMNADKTPGALQLNQRLSNLFKAMDAQNTAELKRLMERWGWFNSAKFGVQTESHAWLIVQHADDDPAFQRQVLAIVEPLVQRGEADRKTYAYLFDRVAMSFLDPSRSRPQRYGTQGHCVGPGTWEPFPVEDPNRLDERRKAMGLPPEADYIVLFKDRCPQADPVRVPAKTTAAQPAQSAAK